MTFAQALEKAKENGHIPGKKFSPYFVFCQNCNAPLVYEDYGHGYQIPGLHFSKCSNVQ